MAIRQDQQDQTGQKEERQVGPATQGESAEGQLAASGVGGTTGQAGQQGPQEQGEQEESRIVAIMEPYFIYDAWGRMSLNLSESAKAFVMYFFPMFDGQCVVDALDENLPRLLPTEHVKDSLRQGASDVWQEFPTRYYVPSKVRVQFEIKGASDAFTNLVSAINMLEDAKQEADESAVKVRSLAPRVTAIVNLGKQRWGGLHTLEEHFPGSEIFEDLVPRCRYVIVDLSQVPLDIQLAVPDRNLAISLGANKCANEPEETGKEGIAKVLRLAQGNERWLTRLAIFWERVYPEEHKANFRRAVRETGIGVDAMLTIEQANIARGRAEGMVETTLTFARQIFPNLPDWWEARLRSGTEEQVKEWQSRLLGAPDPESVFNGSGGRT